MVELINDALVPRLQIADETRRMDAVAIAYAAECMHTPERDPSTNRNSRLQLKPRRKLPIKRRYQLVQLSPSDAENEDDNLLLLRRSPKLRKRSADEMLSTPKSQAKTSPVPRTPRRPIKAKRRLLDDLDKIAEEEAEELMMKQEAQKVTHRLFEGSSPKRIALEKKEEEEEEENEEVRTKQETKKTTRVLFEGSTPKRLARLAM